MTSVLQGPYRHIYINRSVIGLAYFAVVCCNHVPFNYPIVSCAAFSPFIQNVFSGPWPQFNVSCALSALLSMPFTFSLWANLILCFV